MIALSKESRERFASNIDKDGPVCRSLGTKCWLWTGKKSKGYGRWFNQKQYWTAHRVAYELANGPIAGTNIIKHKCTEPLCVNPDHLFDGSELTARFWKKVNKDGPVHPRLGTKCWLWTGSVHKDGYGTLSYKRTNVLAHRVSYELANGHVPEGQVIRHACDVPACVNPAHLIRGTQQDNIRDMCDRGRRATTQGSNNGRAVLNDAKVIKICKLLDSGVSRKEIRVRFNVTHAIVYHIATGKTWTHLPCVAKRRKEKK